MAGTVGGAARWIRKNAVLSITGGAVAAGALISAFSGGSFINFNSASAGYGYGYGYGGGSSTTSSTTTTTTAAAPAPTGTNSSTLTTP